MHILKLLRNFFPGIIGFAVGAYFAFRYYIDQITIPGHEWIFTPGFSFDSWHQTGVYVNFWISVAFVVGGILINLVWLGVLVKLGVDEKPRPAA